MLDLSRREAFVSAAVVALAAGVPSWALAQAPAGGGGAAWDLRDIYPTDAAWEAERQAILAKIPSLLQYQGKLGRSAAGLKAALQAQSDLNKRASRLYTYASLKADEDCPHRRQPGAQATGAGRVHGAGRSDRLGQSGAGRDRRRQGQPVHRRRSRAQEVRVRPARRPSPGRPHPVARRREVAGLGRNAACRTAGHSRPADLLRHSAADGEAQRRARNPARRPGLYDRPLGAQPRRPQDGLRQVLGELQGVRKLARRIACDPGQGRHVPGQGAALRQRAAGGARRQQFARSGVSLADRRNQPRACRCCIAISRCASGCSGCPTWAIGTFIRRW